MQKEKLVYGVGLNDAGYPVTAYAVIDGRKKRVWMCPFYDAWTGMIERCYSAKFQNSNPAYTCCSVATEWLSFMSFRAWMVRQDHEGKQLDKDILIPGNKVYSPQTCVFVSSQLNSFLADSRAARGEWPIGVCRHKPTGKLAAQCNNPFTGKRGHLGLFTCPDAAREAWRARKHQYACVYADQQTDPRIAAALRSRYEHATKIFEACGAWPAKGAA